MNGARRRVSPGSVKHVLEGLVAHARRSAREAVSPRILLRWVMFRNRLSGEPELRLVSELCDPRRASLDVGACMGTYGHAMRGRSSSVVLIEPNPVAARWLGRAFGRGVDVRQIAASDADAIITLRVPRDPGRRGMATIDPENDLEDVEIDTVDVQARRLDGLALGPIGLIKIDVEGHEAAVLRGSAAIIERDRPAFIIEAEERHRPGAVRDVETTLAGHGYDGWFLRDERLHPLSAFDVDRDQPADGVVGGTKLVGDRYVNNFIFVHREDPRHAAFVGRHTRG